MNGNLSFDSSGGSLPTQSAVVGAPGAALRRGTGDSSKDSNPVVLPKGKPDVRFNPKASVTSVESSGSNWSYVNPNSSFSPTTADGAGAPQPQQQQQQHQSQQKRPEPLPRISVTQLAEAGELEESIGSSASGRDDDILSADARSPLSPLNNDSFAAGSQAGSFAGSQAKTSSAGGSSNHNKEHLLGRALEMLESKDRDELLNVDIDERELKESNDGKVHDVADDLEECAADNEKAKRFYAEILDNPFCATIVVNAHSQQIVWCNAYSSFLFNLVESDIVGEDVSILLGAVPGRNNREWHRKKVAHFVQTWKHKRAMPETKIVTGRLQEVGAARYEGIKKVNFTAQMVVRPVQMSFGDSHSPPLLLVGYIRDFSSEKHLRTMMASSTFITTHASESIVVLDTTGTIMEMNKSAAELFGYDNEFLVRTEANIKLLMPVSIARVHDRYMAGFRDKLATPGFDMKNSPIINKARDLVARRADGVEFPVQLIVQMHLDATRSGQDRLVGYFRDSRALIKASDFNVEVSKRLFPESIANIVSQKSEIRHVETYRNIPVILMDMVGFTGKTRNMDNEGVFEMVNTLYKNVAEIAVGYQVEVVKSTGDGVIAVCGIDEFDEPRSRMDRAVCFALAALRWCHDNEVAIRVGIGYGELGSAVFEISKGRPTWDIWATAVNEASRMEHHASPMTLQITALAHRAMRDPGLAPLFSMREHAPGSIKGVSETGAATITYETNFGSDFTIAGDVCDRVLNAALSRVFLKRENARSLKEQQERRRLTSDS